MATNKVICDTGVISDFLEGKDSQVLKTIEEIGKENVYITPVILVELNRWLSIRKGLTKQERNFFKKFFDSLPLIHLNEKISSLVVKISNSDNSLDAPDILIGATALYHNIPVYTNNRKHFKRIKEIMLL